MTINIEISRRAALGALAGFALPTSARATLDVPPEVMKNYVRMSTAEERFSHHMGMALFALVEMAPADHHRLFMMAATKVDLSDRVISATAFKLEPQYDPAFGAYETESKTELLRWQP